MQKALESYREATTIVSDRATNGEAAFWVGITLAGEGDREGALPWLARAYSQDDRWARLVPRLVASGLLVDEDDLVDYLVEGMKKGAEKMRIYKTIVSAIFIAALIGGSALAQDKDTNIQQVQMIWPNLERSRYRFSGRAVIRKWRSM